MPQTKETIYNKALYSYNSDNILTAIEYLKKAICLAKLEEPQDLMFLFEKNTELAQMHIESNAAGNSLPFFNDAYNTFKSNVNFISNYEETYETLELLGNIAFFLEFFDKALECYSHACSLCYCDEVKQLIEAKKNLALGYMGNYSESLANFKQLVTVIKHKSERNKILKFYCDILFLTGNYQEALNNYRQIIETTQNYDAENQSSWILDAIFNSGIIHYELGNFSESLNTLKELLVFLDKTDAPGSSRLELDTRLQISKTLLITGNKVESIKVLNSINEDDLYVFDKPRYQITCAYIQLLSHNTNTTFKKDYLDNVSKYPIETITNIDDIAILVLQEMKYFQDGEIALSLAINQRLINYYQRVSHVPELIRHNIIHCKRKISSDKYFSGKELTSILDNTRILLNEYEVTTFGILRLIELAELYLHNQEYNKAFNTLMDVCRNQRFIFRNYVISAEVQRIYYHDIIELILNIAYNLLDSIKDIYRGRLIEEYINLHLKFQGFSVLSNMFFRRYLSNCRPEHSDLIINYINTIKKLDSNTYSNTDRFNQLKTEVEILEHRVKSETDYFENVVNHAHINWIAVRKKLENHEAALSFCRYEHLDNTLIDRSGYFVFIIRGDNKRPIFIDLAITDDQLKKLLPFFTVREHGNKFPISANVGRLMIKNLSELYKNIFKPVEASLKNIKTLYFTADGLLNYIPLGALTDENKICLMEKTKMVQLQQLRDIKSDNDEIALDSISIFGGIDYGHLFKNMDESRANFGSDTLAGISEIREAMFETTEINKIFLQKSLKSKLIKHLDLNTLQQENKENATCMHIVTHGFFFNDEHKCYDLNDFAAYSIQDIKNHSHPLLRSGLFASDYNFALTDSALKPDTKGVITSYDLSKTDLGNTKLITLHACETALGAVRNGETFGLPKALKLAGVKYLILTLWEIRFTKFYIYFYHHLTESGGKEIRKAFQKAINDVKRESPNPYWWSGFVLIE